MVNEYLAADPTERGTLGRIIAEYDSQLLAHFHQLETTGPEGYDERRCLQDLFLVAAVGPHEDPRDLTYFLDVIVTAALLMDRNTVQKCYDQAAAMAGNSGFGCIAERIRKYPSIFWNQQDRPGKEYWL